MKLIDLTGQRFGRLVVLKEEQLQTVEEKHFGFVNVIVVVSLQFLVINYALGTLALAAVYQEKLLQKCSRKMKQVIDMAN